MLLSSVERQAVRCSTVLLLPSSDCTIPLMCCLPLPDLDAQRGQSRQEAGGPEQQSQGRQADHIPCAVAALPSLFSDCPLFVLLPFSVVCLSPPCDGMAPRPSCPPSHISVFSVKASAHHWISLRCSLCADLHTRHVQSDVFAACSNRGAASVSSEPVCLSPPLHFRGGYQGDGTCIGRNSTQSTPLSLRPVDLEHAASPRLDQAAAVLAPPARLS